MNGAGNGNSGTTSPLKSIEPQRELASQSWPSTLVPQRRLSNVRLRSGTDNDFGHLLISVAFSLSQVSQ